MSLPQTIQELHEQLTQLRTQRDDVDRAKRRLSPRDPDVAAIARKRVLISEEIRELSAELKTMTRSHARLCILASMDALHRAVQEHAFDQDSPLIVAIDHPDPVVLRWHVSSGRPQSMLVAINHGVLGQLASPFHEFEGPEADAYLPHTLAALTQMEKRLRRQV